MSYSGHIPPEDPPDWLPAGWTVEVKSSGNGRNVKSYIHQLTGYRFYSKTKVLEYLGTVKNNSWTGQKEIVGGASYINFSEEINGTAGSLPQGYVLETPPQENGSQSGKSFKIGAWEMLQHEEMVAETSADWLPAGWTEEIKERNGRTVKTYVDPLWGHRFYSKPQVLQYLGFVTDDNYTAQRETSGNNSESNLLGKINGTPELLPDASTLTTSWENGSHSKQGASEMPRSSNIVTEETPDWLPAGWTEEVKHNNGRSVKCYIDSLTGRKFYSKRKVLEYLGTAKIKGGTSERKKIGNDFDINLPVQINDPTVILPHGQITELESRDNGSGAGKSFKLPVKTIDSELPDGWITEVKHRKIGSSDAKSYERYIDPVTGRKFFSKQKVFEYLGTVKPNNSTSRRKKTTLDDASKHGMDKIEAQNAKTPEDTIHLSRLKEISYRNRPGEKPNRETVRGGTLSPQLVEPQNMKTLNHTAYTPILKETSYFEQPGRKIGSMAHLSPQGLPPGWKKEIKIKKIRNKTIKTQYYIDPVSGYVFTSLIDSWRYTETGDTSKCVTKPKTMEKMGFSYDGSSSFQPNVNSRGGGIPLPQLVESQDMNTPNHIGYTSILNEKSSSEQPGRKIGVEHLSPQGLPPGWIKEIKIQKTANKTRRTVYYIDPVGGYVLSSLKDVWRYVESGDLSKCLTKPKKREEMGFATDQSLPNGDNILSNSPLQLLDGAKHVNTRKRTCFSPEDGKLSSSKQCNIEPNGDKIVSNTPLQLLAKHVNKRKRARFPPDDGNLSSSKQFDSEIVIERVVAEGLPSGWIKEVKIEKFYTDPRSGYVFMSQKDALCYLETGDIGKCAIKPRSREELGLNEGVNPRIDKTGGGPSLQPASGQPKKSKAGGFHSQYLEQSQNEYTPRLTRLASRHKDMSSSKQSEGEIVVEKVIPRSVAPGSIKVDSIQKKATGARRDMPEIDKTRANPGLQQLNQSYTVNMAKHASLSSPQNKMASSKQSGIEIIIERVPPEGLPPGWIKEIRIQKKADGIRTDQFYTDPISGYVFSSQKDVFRYVETGDIRNCATKPKNRDQLGLNQGSSAASPLVVQKPDHDTAKKQLSSGKNVSSKSLETILSDVSQKRQTRSSVVSPAVVQKLEHDTTNKQLSAGNNVSSKRSLETTDIDVSPKRRQTRASASAVTTKNPTVELAKEVPKVDNVIQKPRKAKKGTTNPTVELAEEVRKVDNVIQKPMKTKKVTKAPTVEFPQEVPKVHVVIQKPTKAAEDKGSSGSPQSKAKVSMRNRGRIGFPPKTKKLQLKNAKRNTTKSSSKAKTRSPSIKTKKEETKKARTPPSRFSKRIVGLNTETVPNSGPSEQALEAEVGNSGENDEIVCLNAPNDVPSCEQALTSEVENSGRKGMPCPNAFSNVTSYEQALTSEVDNPGEDENIPCLNNVADNAPEQLETVLEMGNTVVEKLGENEDILCPNSLGDGPNNTPQQLETVTKLDETYHDLGGGADASSDTDVSNKNNEAAEDQAEDQTLPQERPAEMSNKSKESMEDQYEQTVTLEHPAKVLNKSEAMEDQAENQTISQDQPLYQIGVETWSDPCLDFAFKTLTGTLPFEDNVQVHNVFQLRADTSPVKTTDNCLALLDFGAPNVRQVDDSHAQNGSKASHQVDNSETQNGSEASAKSEHVTQLLNNPRSLPDMNNSLPSGNETATQQADSEENTINYDNVLTLDNYARYLF